MSSEENQEKNSSLAVQVQSPVDMIRAAKEAGIEAKDIKEYLELQIQYQKSQIEIREQERRIEAQKQFTKAMSDFKSKEIVMTKDKLNKQYGSMYTSLGNMVRTVTPVLSRYGLSAAWNIRQEEKISVTCVVTHVLGHSEKVEAFAPADSSGAKNPIQGIKSTITYLKSVTLESILGLASTDANCDDDGNAASGKPEKIMTDAQKSALLDTMTDKGVSESNLCAFLKVESLEDLSEDLYNKAMQSLKNIKRKEQN